MEQLNKNALIQQLKQDILNWQGYKTLPDQTSSRSGLEGIEAAFPNGRFPIGSLHEFVCNDVEHQAATAGFITGLLNQLFQKKGFWIWIGSAEKPYPPAMTLFGTAPDHIIFIEALADKKILWVMEEALQCDGLTAVIAEVKDLSFTQSRRLQLIMEKSRVTGFIIRKSSKQLNSTTCVARWKIQPLPSELASGVPGVGFPRWQVELLKVRNGNPGSWNIEWSPGGFKFITPLKIQQENQKRKAG